MSLTSNTIYNNPSKEEKAAKISDMQRFWKDQLGPEHKILYLVPKFVYTPQGSVEQSIRCFASEMTKGDILIEFVDSNFDPLGSERCLHILHHRADFATEYEATTYDSFLIPISKLFVFMTEKKVSASTRSTIQNEIPLEIVDLSSSSIGEMTFVNDKIKADESFSSITIRDFYSIIHKKPVSNKKWLNMLIQSNL
jgi:hypothetical protein